MKHRSLVKVLWITPVAAAAVAALAWAPSRIFAIRSIACLPSPWYPIAWADANGAKSHSAAEAVAAAAQRRPGDPAIQLAGILMRRLSVSRSIHQTGGQPWLYATSAGSPPPVRQLQSLHRTFPQSLLVTAVLLRSAVASQETDSDRPESVYEGQIRAGQAGMGAVAAQAVRGGGSAATPTGAANGVDATAQTAERLDPENGYFPVMRAILFWQGGDEQHAQAALSRAAHCETFNTFTTSEGAAIWRLYTETWPGADAMTRLAVYSSADSMPWMLLTDMVTGLMYGAQKLERAGNPRAGIQLRRELAGLAVLMEQKSSRLAPLSEGDTILQTIAETPGGNLPAREIADIGQQTELAQARGLVNWIRSQGDSADASWFAAELARGDATTASVDAAVNSPHARALGAEAAQFRAELVSSGAAQLLLCIVTLLAGAFLANAAARLIQRRAPYGLSISAQRASLIVIAAVPSATLLLEDPTNPLNLPFGLTLLIVVAGIALWPRVPLVDSAKAAVFGILIASVLTAGICLFATAWRDLSTGYAWMMASVAGYVAPNRSGLVEYRFGGMALLFLAVPAIIALAALAKSLWRKQPAILGTVRGFGAAAAPAAAVLTILFCLLCIHAGQADRTAARNVSRQWHNERAWFGIGQD